MLKVCKTEKAINYSCEASVFPCDDICVEYLKNAGVDTSKIHFEWADPDAVYAKELTIDMSTVVPVVAKPHEVDKVVPAKELEGTKIDQFFLVLRNFSLNLMFFRVHALTEGILT